MNTCDEFRVIIPARQASERLPGKALADIHGRPMIRYVWERARASGAKAVIVATDSEEICNAVETFGGNAVLTREDHVSGTDRIAEVVAINGWPDDAIVVNLQGDEPMMPPGLIRQVADILQASGTEMATLATPLTTAKEFDDPNVVKVVTNRLGNALYFSRAPIPSPRDLSGARTLPPVARRHLGLYAYRCGALRELVAASPAELELTEKLEQLRALYLGHRIRVGDAGEVPGVGVDTPADLERVRALLANI